MAPTLRDARVTMSEVGWTRRGVADPNRMRCMSCGHETWATMAAAMTHHDVSLGLKHAGQAISRCTSNRISSDGP
jgi:hypothetical protein